MYRLAVAMLGADNDAEEVVQEAFVGVSSRWEGLDNPGGYLRVSVVNGCRKRMRSRARRRAAELTMRGDPTAVSVGQGEYLLDVLDGLTDRQRVAVVLTYYSGLNSGEVGELMDCRPATVRSLVRTRSMNSGK
jgi:RNA polymerase sigma factor (sigma-70 family)